MSKTDTNAEVAAVKVNSIAPDRLGKSDLIITYKIPQLNTIHTFKIPAENQTPQSIANAVKNHYDREVKIIPRSVKLG